MPSPGDPIARQSEQGFDVAVRILKGEKRV
jgi:hypothetical protein